MRPLLAVLLTLLLPSLAQAHIWVGDFTYYNLPVSWTGHGHTDMVEATRYGDELAGQGGWDRIKGMGGRDIVRGNAGDDLLFGNAGSDILYGGYGNDFIDGGGGEDWCYGGPGLDIYKNCEHTG